jgi:hypothetical protein
MDTLECGGRTVKMRHLKPRFVAQIRNQPVTIVIDPQGKPPRGAFLSLVKILVWLIEEWYAYLFHEKGETVLVCDRYYHDLLVDPRRYRFGAPVWTAALVGKLMPRPRLWVLLDAPPDVLQVRKQEVSAAETARQCYAYRTFVRKQRRHAVVDASQPLDKVIADAAYAIEAAVLEDAGNRG